MITPHPRIETRSDSGPNGFLVPIWHVDSGPKIEQVYLTVVAPGAVKGPHLHMRRRGLFTCIKGNIRLVTRSADCYQEHDIGEDHNFATSEVPAGIAAALYNVGDVPAYVLNMPSPPWRENEPDEWPVEDWTYRIATP